MALYFGKNVRTLTPQRLLKLVPGTELERCEPDKSRVYAALEAMSIAGPTLSKYPAHLYAAARENQPVVLHTPIPLYIESAHAIPIKLPPLCIQYPRGIPEEYNERILSMGFDRDSIRGKEYLIFRELSIEQLRIIDKSGPSTTNFCPANTVNLHGMKHAILLLRLLSVVYGTLRRANRVQKKYGYWNLQAYTTLRTETESVLTRGSQKRKSTFTSGEIKEFSFKVQKTGEESDALSNTKTTSYVLDMPGRQKGEPLFTMVVACHEIEECNTASYNEYELDEQGSGLFFPFILDMADPDHSIIPRFIHNHLLYMLGDTAQQRMELADNLASAWGNLNASAFGFQVAHFCKCLELAMVSEATISSVVFHGRYQGSVLVGDRFSMTVDGKRVEPVKFDELKEVLQQVNTHGNALTAILKIVDDNEMNEDEVGQHGPESFDTMRDLHLYLFRKSLLPSEREQIIELAGRLQFNERFFGFTENFITKAFDLIVSTDDIPTHIPMYHKYIFSTDRLEQVMAAFGSKAPTFEIPGGQRRALGTSGGVPNTNNFITRYVDVSTAIRDLKKIMETKYVTNWPGSTSDRAGDKKYRGIEKERLWSGLRRVSNVTVTVTSLVEEPRKTAATAKVDLLDF